MFNGFLVALQAIKATTVLAHQLYGALPERPAVVQTIIWWVNGRQPVFLVNTLKTLYDRSMARTSFTLVMLALAGGN